MFGNTQPPANPDPANPQVAKPMSALEEQAQSFFSNYGGKVSVASAPRPVRPGTTRPPSPAPYTRPVAAPPLFAETSPEAARLRAEAAAAEADFVDDFFDEGDAPSY